MHLHGQANDAPRDLFEGVLNWGARDLLRNLLALASLAANESQRAEMRRV